jgi:hypothetical protein
MHTVLPCGASVAAVHGRNWGVFACKQMASYTNDLQPTQNSELTEWARFAALLPSLLQKVAHGT